MTVARAAVLRTHDGLFAIEELQLDEPRDDEVVVKMVAVGVCHTDLLTRELPPEYFPGPMVYGHEGAGVVERVGSAVTKVAPGDHVVLSFRACGACKACSSGHPAYCAHMRALNSSGARPDGTTAFSDCTGARVGSHYFGQSAFASTTVAAEASVVKVDPFHDLVRLSPLGCGIQTGAGAVLRVFEVQPSESIVIAGAGTVGLAAVMAAKAAQAKTIIAIDRHDSRLELARKYGATEVFNLPADELAAAILGVTGDGSDYMLDLTGNAQVIRAGFDGLNGAGTLGLCGVGFGEVAFDMSVLLSGRTIKTVIEGDSVPEQFIPHLIELNAQGLFPYDDLIQRFPFDEINEAIAASVAGTVVKPVLVF